MRENIILFILSLSALSFAARPTNIKLTVGAHTMTHKGTQANGGSGTVSAGSLFKVPNIEDIKNSNFEAGLELESNRAINFSDAISFENNLGLESAVTFKSIKLSTVDTFKQFENYKKDLYITNIIYYQPALKFTFVKDFSLKFGLKVGTGLAMHKGNNGGAKPVAAKPAATTPSNNWKYEHENVLGAILGFGIKNFLIETEFSDRFTIDWASHVSTKGISEIQKIFKSEEIAKHIKSNYVVKVKLGYSFGR